MPQLYLVKQICNYLRFIDLFTYGIFFPLMRSRCLIQLLILIGYLIFEWCVAPRTLLFNEKVFKRDGLHTQTNTSIVKKQFSKA